MFVPRKVEHFSIDSKWLRESPQIRLDASFFNPRLAKALESLRKSDFKLKTLAAVTDNIFIPPRFRRIYVEREHGIAFLQGSHVVHFQPADIKYLSKTAQKNLHKWIIKDGWILVTCSGTIGRVTIAPPEWNEWAASQHILRIIPQANGECPHGYISAFLRSPIGQAQLTAQRYGAVVDELTEDQARSVLVPVPRTDKQKKDVEDINKLALESVRLKSKASNLATLAVDSVLEILPKQEPEPAETLAVEEAERVETGSSRRQPY